MALFFLMILMQVPTSCGSVFEPKPSDVETSLPSTPPENVSQPKTPPDSDVTPTSVPEIPATNSARKQADPEADTAVPNELNLTQEFIYLNENELRLSFNEWLAQLPGKNTAAAGTHFDASRRTLSLSQNTALSFSNFLIESPIVIRTHGHHLILAGDELDKVHVDTTNPTGASGSLYIFTPSRSVPTFRVEGSAGAQGADGDCGPLAKSCVGVADQTSRTIAPLPDVEWSEQTLRRLIHWESEQLTPSIRETIKKQLLTLTPKLNAGALCDTDMSSALHETRVSFEGYLELHQTVKMPIGLASGNAQHAGKAVLHLGAEGQSGQDAGRVVVVDMDRETQSRRTLIPGGAGGRGGRNYKSARTAARDRIVVRSVITSEHFDLSELKARTVLSGACAGEVGRRPQRVSREFLNRLTRQSIAMPSGLKLAERELVVEASPEGTDSLIDTPEHQPDGLPGRNGSLLHLTFSSAAAWRKLLPKHVLVGR